MPADVDLEGLRDVALAAALAGGEVIRGAKGAGRTDRKGAGDYVTEVDREAERAIGRSLAAATPEIPVLAEEEGGSRTSSRTWVVDPLDGTANFVHGFPIVGVSVGLVEEGRPVAGAVHAPFLAQTWVGAAGLGAEVTGEGAARHVAVSRRPLREAIVGTGFPFRDRSIVPRYLAMFERCFERFEDLRRPGAAALDLAWVAAGVFDGFFELNLSPWDVAAGALLVREAGGVVTDWDGHPDRWLETGNILAGSPAVHEALLEMARP